MDKAAVERVYLSGREYAALRSLFGAFNALVTQVDALEKRCKMIPGGWRDMKMLCKVADNLMTNILRTIPQNKLQAINRELKNTICEIKVQNVSGKVNGEKMVYCPEMALVRLTAEAIDVQCLGCERQWNECRKNCELYKAIQDCFHWEIEPEEDGRCPFHDGVLVGEDG